MGQVTFKSTLETTLREAANDNLGAVDAARLIVDDLSLAGFAIKRTHDPVNYGLPIMVVHAPAKGTAGSFNARPQVQAKSVDDLRGTAGWLVIWSELGRTRSAWFDHEGVSVKLPDYRVVNPKTPCAGALAAQTATPTQKVA